MQTFLQNTSYWIVLLPLIVGFATYRQLTKHSRIILLLTVVATPPQFISFITRNEAIQNIFYNIYTLLEFLILYFLFYALLKLSVYRNLLSISLFIYLFSVSIIIWIHGIAKEELACAICINNLTYCFWILLFLYFDLKEESTIIKFQGPVLWYAIAIFIYAAATCIYFALKPYTDKNNITVKLLHNLANIQMYVCFTIGFVINSWHYTLQNGTTCFTESSSKLNLLKA